MNVSVQKPAQKVLDDLRTLIRTKPEIVAALTAQGLTLFDSEGTVIERPQSFTPCWRCSEQAGCRLSEVQTSAEKCARCVGHRLFEIEPVKIHGKIVGWIGIEQTSYETR